MKNQDRRTRIGATTGFISYRELLFFLPRLVKRGLSEGDLFLVRISSLTENMSCPSVGVSSLTVSVCRYFFFLLRLFLALMNVVLVFLRDL